MTHASAPIIRSALPDDATAIAEIKVAAWRAAYRSIVPDSILDGLDVGNVRDNWLGVSPSDLARYGIVAMRDGDLGGYALFGAATRPVGDFDGQIFELYVLPDQFGRGLAARLLDAALARLRERGGANTMLWVFEANARARRFYEKHGWARIPRAELFTEIGSARLPTVAYGFRAVNTVK